MKTSYKKRKICLITFPLAEAGCIPLQNISKIIKELSTEFYMITGAKGYELFAGNEYIKTYEVTHRTYVNSFLRILTYIYTQIKISIQLFKVIMSVDMVIFFIGGETLILPFIISKLFRKKTILILSGSTVEILEILDSKASFKNYAKVLSRINYHLSDKIILYSSSLVNRWNLEKFHDKISIASEHSINLKKFRKIKPFNRRHDVVGFVGRFSYEKGILNFIKSIKCVVKEFPNFNFIIIGDGPLKTDLELYINENNLKKNILLTGWIQHEDLVQYLNEMKVLVTPSLTEGLPNVILEAMACGTPVIATNVGSIPDIIKNSKNGYIIENNNANEIYKAVTGVITSPGLENTSSECIKTIEENYRSDLVVKRWEEILNQI